MRGKSLSSSNAKINFVWGKIPHDSYLFLKEHTYMHLCSKMTLFSNFVVHHELGDTYDTSSKSYYLVFGHSRSLLFKHGTHNHGGNHLDNKTKRSQWWIFRGSAHLHGPYQLVCHIVYHEGHFFHWTCWEQ